MLQDGFEVALGMAGSRDVKLRAFDEMAEMKSWWLQLAEREAERSATCKGIVYSDQFDPHNFLISKA